MRFLRTLFWATALIANADFLLDNWDTYVPVRLWGDPVFWYRLPSCWSLHFLLGFLPYCMLHRATRWSLGASSTTRGAPADRIA